MCARNNERDTMEAMANRSERHQSSTLLNWTVPVLLMGLLIWTSIGLAGFRPVSIVTGSMKPAIDAGDLVIVRNVPPEEIGVGDIIQFSHEHGSMTVVHRVVDTRDQEVFITKGDANLTRDAEPVPADRVLGRVEICIPKVGWLPIYIKNFFGSILGRG